MPYTAGVYLLEDAVDGRDARRALGPDEAAAAGATWPRATAETMHRALLWGLETASSGEALDRWLRAHARPIAALGVAAADLWADVRDQARRRRHDLTGRHDPAG